jgi:ABC-2 type transport system ATP-binding protein
VEARLALHHTLRDLRDSGTTILLTTHDLDEARVLSDRVGILASGSLVETGPVHEILRRMFGDTREIEVTLSREPNETAGKILKELGLAATANPLVWASWSAEVESLGKLEAALSRHGIGIHEIRLREPGLEQVLSRIGGDQR